MISSSREQPCTQGEPQLVMCIVWWASCRLLIQRPRFCHPDLSQPRPLTHSTSHVFGNIRVERRTPFRVEILIALAREESRNGHQTEYPTPDSMPFSFADDVTSNDLLQPGDISGSERWFLPPSSPLALPPLPAGFFDITGENGGRRSAEIACSHSHVEVLRMIPDGDDDVTIIFEDDIDMEWDLERRLRYLWQFLPSKWDSVMLVRSLYFQGIRNGASAGDFVLVPTNTLCTHAYAVSKKSAAHLGRLLRSPLLAYSLPVDEGYALLYSDKQIYSFSLYPPTVTQSSATTSDVSSGMGSLDFSDRRYALADSALERMRS